MANGIPNLISCHILPDLFIDFFDPPSSTVLIVTQIYKQFGPFGRGTTPVRGFTDHSY